jgi:hypothetical protein
MKNIIQIAALSFLLVTVIGGCKKKNRDLEGPSSKLEGIQDVWVLDQVQQLDPSNKDLIIDVTDAFKDSTPIELDVNSSDFSYAFNRSNPLFLGTSGTWKFDDNQFPTQIEMSGDAGVETVKLLQTIRTVDPKLRIQLTRYCGGGTTSTIYQFSFTRK